MNSIIFGVYGNTLRNVADTNPTTSQIFTAGIAAGVASCCVTTPLDLIKIQLQVNNRESFLKCTKKALQKHGVKGLFKGFSVTMIRDVPSYGFYFVSYAYWKKLFGDGYIGSLLSGGCAGATSWLVAYPIDVIKTRIQVSDCVSKA